MKSNVLRLSILLSKQKDKHAADWMAIAQDMQLKFEMSYHYL